MKSHIFTKTKKIITIKYFLAFILIIQVFAAKSVHANPLQSQIKSLINMSPGQISNIAKSTPSAEYITTGSTGVYAMFGYSVNSAGDVNNDGYDDVIIGARDFSVGGAAFLYLGSASGDFSSPYWSVQGNQQNASMGNSVDSAGDVNGDGFDDIIVGDPGYSSGQQGEGAAFVYYGSSNGASTIPDWTGQANQAGAAYGWSVSKAGDVNNDGYDDILVGSRYYENGQTDEGRVFLYLGSPLGLSASSIWTKEIDINNAGFGYVVNEASDVNGDGFDDVLITSWNYIYGQLDGGKAYLFLGDANGLSNTPLWVGESSITMDGYGYSGSSAGDVNNDGFSDILIGAPAYDNSGVEGKAYLYLGSTLGPNQTPDWVTQDGTTSTAFGASVSFAGDYNHDGYDDVIVGDPNYYANQAIGGAVYLYLGSSDGLSMHINKAYTSGVNNSAFATSIGSVGHFNNDFYDDFLVGSPMWTTSPYYGGRASLIVGHKICKSTTIVVANANDTGPGSLRQAIEDICSNGMIYFSPSLSGQNIHLSSAINISTDVTIDGTALEAHVIINGDTDNNDIGDTNLLTVSSLAIVNIKGLDFAKGYTSTAADSGGINNDGYLIITDSKFYNNTGDSGGAIINKGEVNIYNSDFYENSAMEGTAIFNAPGANAMIITSSFTQNNGSSGAIGNMGSLFVSESEFSENTSILGGSAIVNGSNANATISLVTFSSNTTQGKGGAIYNMSGTLNITDSIFSLNSAEANGGAIFNQGQLSLERTNFISNSAGSDGGGSIYNDINSTATIKDCEFSQNNAYGPYGSGGAIVNLGELSVSKCTFFENTATIGGGAIVNILGGITTITNSTIASNSAPNGGGIITLENTTTTISYSTISDNTGGGIYIFDGIVQIDNSILANSLSKPDCYKSNGSITLSPNTLIETTGSEATSCGMAQLTTDPMLNILADNGGPTQTMALPPGSPAINAGDNSTCTETDQRGVERPQGANCDLGAYEYEDNIAPTVLSIVKASASPSNAANVNFTVTFTSNVTGVDSDGSDFSLTTTGGIIGASITGVTPVSAAVYTVSVNTGTGNGTIRLDVPNTASIKDLANNELIDLPFTSGETYTILKVSPKPVGAPLLSQPKRNSLLDNATPSFVWNSVANATEYEIIIATDSSFSQIVVTENTLSPSFTLVDPLADGKYFWHVRAYNAAAQPGKFSATQIFSIDTTPPAAPLLTSPMDTATLRSSPVFRWIKVTGVVLYEFQYDNDADFSSPVYSITTKNSYSKPPAMSNGTFYWRVRAQDIAGNWSSWSLVRSVTISR